MRLMNLGKYLSSMIKPELEELKEVCNFTDDEKEVFDKLAKGQSVQAIALNSAIARSTVSNRVKSIQNKINKAKEWEGVNGKFQ